MVDISEPADDRLLGTPLAQFPENLEGRGEVLKSFEHGNGMSIGKDGTVANVLNGKPLWSWNYVNIHDVQTNRVSLPELVRSSGGYTTHYNDENDYNRYLTVSAMRRLGS